MTHRCSRCKRLPIGFGKNGRHCWTCAKDLAHKALWKIAR